MKKLLSVQKTLNTKLVGAAMPLQFCNYMTLYVLAKGITKSRIIREVLEVWKRNNQSEEELIQEIICAAQATYRSKKGMSLISFKDQLRKELKSKRLNSEQIKNIVEGI